MPTTTHTPIDARHVWLGADIQESERWIHRLDGGEIAEIDAALAHFRGTGKSLAAMTRADFPLPTCAGAINAMLGELEHGLLGARRDAVGHAGSRPRYLFIDVFGDHLSL